MVVTTKYLKDAYQTGRAMYAIVDKYYLDMAPWADLSFLEMFDLIKNIPFQPDPENIELLKRPFYTMNRMGPGGDCDCKAIAAASWAKMNGFPYRFVAVGRKNPNERKILLSHVFLQVYILGKWLIFDATYSYNTPGQVTGGYDRIEILKP